MSCAVWTLCLSPPRGFGEYAERVRDVFDPALEAGDWGRMWPDPPEHHH